MKAIQRVAVFLGGYAPTTVRNESPDELDRISKLGATVLFAVIIATVNWGIAGWIFLDGKSTAARFMAVFIASTFGAFLVLMLDRSALYFIDTAQSGKGIKTLLIALPRIFVILLISSITSQAIIPCIFKDELQVQALHMMEEFGKNRFSDLTTINKVNEKQDAIKAEEKKKQDLEKAASGLPDHIQKRMAGVNVCWQQYGSEKNQLIATGYTEAEAKNSMAWKAAICAHERNAAIQEKNSYINAVRAKQKDTTAELDRLRKEFESTTSKIKGKMDNAEKIEGDSLNYRSSTVLWNLLRNNQGVRMKWALISMLFVSLELLPLLLKLTAGQSNIGRKIALSRYANELNMKNKKLMFEHDYHLSKALYETSKGAIDEALNSPVVKEYFKTHFVKMMSAIAPTEAVRSLMVEFEKQDVNIQDFMRLYPRYASLIFQAWTQAIKDASEIIVNPQNVNAGI